MPTACAQCGSTLLQHAAAGPAEFAFEEAAVECLHCGHAGEPRQFRSVADIEHFRMNVRRRD